jgi:hypothetical protein
VEALYSPTHSYVLHLDASAPAELHAQLLELRAALEDPAALTILPPIEVKKKHQKKKELRARSKRSMRR